MAGEKQAHNSPQDQRLVLLVIIGGLGDWCIRRVLDHAKTFEKNSKGKVTVVVVDIHPRRAARKNDTFNEWDDEIDRWIVRRLIEQAAEGVDQPLRDKSGRALKGLDWSFTGRLAKDPKLPDPTEDRTRTPDDAIEKFAVDRGHVFEAAYRGDKATLQAHVNGLISGYLDYIEAKNPDAKKLTDLAKLWGITRDITSFAEFKDAVLSIPADQLIQELVDKVSRQLTQSRETLREWLRGVDTVFGREVHRYWRSESGILVSQRSDGGGLEVVSNELKEQLAKDFRIIVYAATPPEAYPDVLSQWSAYAERIALEKPVAGLLEEDK